jgi:hypothetical protein
MKRGKLVLLVLVSLVSLTGMASAVEFNYWLTGTTQPDVAKFNGSWWDLSDKSEAPTKQIYSGDFNKDYFYLGEANSHFTLFNGSFTSYSKSETPLSGKILGLSANSTHAVLGTEQKQLYLFETDTKSFTDLGNSPDDGKILTVTNSYSSDVNKDHYAFGTEQKNVYKWNGSFYQITPSFIGGQVQVSGSNSTHWLFGDTQGNIGIYNGSSWTDLTGKFLFDDNGASVTAASFGNFGGKPFWLVGGKNGRLERLWVNGTHEDLTGEFPSGNSIKSIGFNDEDNRFFVGTSGGEIINFQESGGFENNPNFPFANSVEYVGYNPYAPAGSASETAPNVSILEPLQDELFGYDDVNLSVKTDQEILKWKYNIDDGENRSAGREGIVYTDSAGNLKELYSDGSVRDFGVDASIVADKAQLDDDKYPEIPFVDGSGNLKIIDRTGENSTLDTGISTSKLMMATGSWKESKEYIFYPDQSDNSYIKKVRKGSGEETIGTGIAAKGVIGPGDFNQDGDRDIVFLGTSDTIKWYDGGAVSSTGFSSFGSNNNKGVGKVTDVDGDGDVRVPYVTGSNNLALINYTGGKYNLNSNYGSAEKTRIAALDWKGDEKKEIMHLDGSTNELKYMYYNGEAKFVKDENFSEVSGQGSVGLAVGKRSSNSINQTLINMSEGVRNVTVWGYDGTYYGRDSVEFTVDTVAPSFRNYGDNVTTDFFQPDTANISAEFRDDTSGLEEVKLSTNETGGFENRTVYGSPETFDNVSDEYLLSDFLWKNESFLGDLGYSLWAGDAAGNYEETSVNSFTVNEIDLEAGNVVFENQDLIEGQNFTVNLSAVNYGADSVSVGVNLTEETYNGTEWVFVDEKSDNITFEADSRTYFSFDETAEIGPRRYTVDIDTEDEVDEENESNNENSSIIDVSSYQIYYGESSERYVLGSQVGLKDWEKESVEGTLYYSDTDASFDIRDLKALNGSSDLQEATSALDLEGHNDSIKKEWDEDADGEPELEGCLVIAGDDVCQIPFDNSTNSSNFQTGILYDSADGTPFDGSQDLIFATNVTYPQKQGRYGVYSYEAKTPATLGAQTGSLDDFIDVRMEFR